MATLPRLHLYLRLAIALVLVGLWTAPSQAQLPSSGWPRHLGNAQNSSLSKAYGAMPQLRWRAASDGVPACPRIGADGTLYSMVYPPNSYYFWELNGKDGSTVLKQPRLNWQALGALTSNGQMVGPSGPNGELAGIDLKTGSLLWSNASTGGSALTDTSFPISIGENGNIYDGYGKVGPELTAFSPTGGKLWEIPGNINASSGPAMDSAGTLYYNVRGGYICARSPADGSIIWELNPTFNSPNFFTDPMLGANGLLYAIGGTVENHLELVAIVAQTGKVKWAVDLGAYPSSALLTGMCLGPKNQVYASVNGGIVTAVDGDTGAILWASVIQLDVPGQQFVGLTCAGDGTVYVPGSNAVYAVDGRTGGILWTYPLPSGETIGSDFSGGNGEDYLANAFAIGPDGSLVFATNAAIYTLESTHVVSISVSPNSVIGGTGTTGTLSLNMPAPSGGFGVTLAASGSALSVSTIVMVPAGATSATFTVSTLPVDGQVTQTISAIPGINQSASVTVLPATFTNFVLAPNSVPGGSTSAGTLTLSSAAGPLGAVVSLKSDNPAASVPAPATVPPGKTTTSFTVTTTGVDSQTTAHISATRNGASFSQPLIISAATLSGVALNPTTVQGGTASTGTVALSGIAGPSGATVALKCSNTNAATVGANVVVPAGKSTATFPVSTIPVASDTTVQISGTLGSTTQSASLTVTAPILVSLTLNPTTVPGGTSSTGTVTISGPAPAYGLPVALSNSLSSATVPASVTVAGGATTAAFTVSTTGVDANTSATITAKLASLKQTATLSITASTLSSVSLNPTSVLGGSPSTGTVTLSGPAGPSGAVITLNSSSIAAKVPASATVPSGKTSATFTVTTSGVNSLTTAAIAASFGSGSAQASLSITPVQISTVSIAPASVQGGTAATGTVTLNGPAAVGGTSVSLSSSSGSASVPASITISAGQRSGTFQIQTSSLSTAASVTIAASANSSSATASLTITAPVLTGLTVNPSTLAGAGTSTGTVTLSGPASIGGAAVSLRSSSSSASLPASVTIPAGSSSSTFTVSASAATSLTTVQITASLGTVTKSAKLTLLPLALSGVTVSPNRVQGGASAAGTVSLNGSVPSGGATVLLKSSLAGVKVPASVKILSGQSSVSFAVSTVGTASEKSSTITATWGGTSVTTTVTLLPPTLTGVTLSPASVTGGTSSTGTVTLSGAAPAGGMVLKLTSTLSSATVPASVTVPAGKTSATFSVKTTALSTNTTVTISASVNGQSKSAQLTILASTLTSLDLKPTSVKGGTPSTATVTLTGPAPKGGITLTLGSTSNSATVPVNLTIAVGKTSGMFTVKTTKVTAQTTLTIWASIGTAKITANLTIK